MFVIARRRFVQKKILGKSIGKTGNLDGKNTTTAPSLQQKKIY